MSENLYRRSSGILLHPTSLPGSFGGGDLGPAAYRFVDFLADARQSLWQVLPLGPPGAGNSPYDARSSLAGSEVLVALEPLVEAGLLDDGDLDAAAGPAEGPADAAAAARVKMPLLRRAFDNFRAGRGQALASEYHQFVERERVWLDDYALYRAIHDARNGQPWYEWDPDLVHREPAALRRWHEALATDVEFHRFVQFLFGWQWGRLKAYANRRGVRIIGDIPIYVAHDSADVWTNQEVFTLDPGGRVAMMAGVPPDLFSETGQLWGNPCYRWDVMARDGYQWWVERVRRTLELVDLVRIDHFRGFQAGWQVPAGETSAIHGEWVPGPGRDLFDRLTAALGSLPIIVEDLGIITPDVEALREDLGYPGMKVLQFAFGGDATNPYLPHNYERNCVVYTGTHDNETTVGWFRSRTPAERTHVQRYLGVSGEDINWDMIRAAWMSVADLAIVPLQDVLGLGNEARMNHPGTAHGNWGWRFRDEDLTPVQVERLARLTELYGRTTEVVGG